MPKSNLSNVGLRILFCGIFLCGSSRTPAVLGQSLAYAHDAPRPIPLTRPQLKQMIEDVKFRTPRIPLPELSDTERAQLDGRSNNYESLLKHFYLGEQLVATTASARGFRGQQDSNMSLDYGFKTELFWIVSRTNNCQYCLGHQESKLLGAGLSEDQIAALDCNWQLFTPAEQAAFAFARKVSFEPHLISESDFLLLKSHYADLQILEMLLSISWNNSINRWKEGVGVPQNLDEGGYSRLSRLGGNSAGTDAGVEERPSGSYLTPTSREYLEVHTHVAPVPSFNNASSAFAPTISNRSPLESWEQVQEQLLRTKQREPRLPLVDIEATRQAMAVDEVLLREPANWLRLLANFPTEGARRANSLNAAFQQQYLSPLFTAQVRWIVARQDRAWYAMAHALEQLQKLGESDQSIQALDGNWESFKERQQALFLVAKNLAASPVILTDDQVGRAVELAGPAAVVQTIHLVTQLAAFDRITEAALLPFED